jgi:hypothetical protein
VHIWAQGKLLGDVELQKTVMKELTTWYVNMSVPSVVSEQTIVFVNTISQHDLWHVFPVSSFCIDWALCKVMREGEIPQFSQAAPKWLLDALQPLVEEEEWYGGATKSTKATRRNTQWRMRRIEEAMAVKVKGAADVRR